jgi:hypothetical protein
MRLSQHQLGALRVIADTGRDHASGMARHILGTATVDSLVRRGLIRYHPYGDGGHGSYSATRLGRKALKEAR